MRKDLYRLLFEQEENQKSAPEKNVSMKADNPKKSNVNDSVDDQIDGLILKYENASIRDDEESIATLAESLRAGSLRYLFEQEEEGMDDAGMEEEDAGEEEDAAADPAGSEDMTVSEPADAEKLPNLDVDAFASRVARLIKNYRNLLNIEESILNRAKNFLDENYGDVFINKFLESLDVDHGIAFDENPNVQYAQDDNFAIGANPAGSGITGGGGG